MPLLYRDIRDEAERCKYENKPECEELLSYCDDAMLEHFRLRSLTANGTDQTSD